MPVSAGTGVEVAVLATVGALAVCVAKMLKAIRVSVARVSGVGAGVGLDCAHELRNRVRNSARNTVTALCFIVSSKGADATILPRLASAAH